MNIAIIAAGGTGSRMGSEQNKLLMETKGKSVLWYTMKSFIEHEAVDGVVIVAHENSIDDCESIVERLLEEMTANSKDGDEVETDGEWGAVVIVKGGSTRQESVKNGVAAVEKMGFEFGKTPEIVLVHNAANPLVTDNEITASIEAATEYGAAVVGRKSINTIKKINEGMAHETLDREGLFEVQTPQTIQFDLFQEALAAAEADGFVGTDDVSLVERLGRKVKCIDASEFNFKITRPADFEYFTFLVNKHGL